MARILVVDDEEHIRRVLNVLLSKQGYAVGLAAGGQEALDHLTRHVYDAVLCDLRMPDLDGLEVLRRIKRHDPEVPVIIITAYASVDTALAAMKQGAYDYISKPFKEDEILHVLAKALERTRILEENRRLRREIEERFDFSHIVGAAPAMKSIFDTIRKVADTRSTVLIQGESGTGKELVAKAIHYNSPRKHKPLVTVNCAAVPTHLIESEFFGYVRGAFTGADRTKKGLFEEAEGSTIFLDEISDLPPELQAKLLRVLQEGEIRRLGDTASRTVDVRVLAATNRDLEAAVEQGKFREDLYYRLNVIPLNIPPLRERPEDVPLLARHFLVKMAERHGRQVKRLSPEAERVLINQPWPGNVRQLENVIEQAVVMAEGETIGSRNLPTALSREAGGLVVRVPEDRLDLKGLVREATALAERQIIARALEKENGNRTRTAQVLGISRRCLITKIGLYGLADDRPA
ncbi:MAG: sigma-54 dependent transcriptional regulator [Proteobacteria bacterium]|nr:sigma-54 dependent transcriptional regulator [Pseudomonadota bacterium]